ncbi:hypothetical protein [Lentibacillus salicampi]|nr:hypothetical protein [Lentibacillus salicampi]
MKKLMTTVALGTLLIAGFASVQNTPNDTAMEVEPRIFSVGQDVSFF